ncbi:MAG TPA: efflux RND transporter periplasmic adaptor subunit [Vicinamibacterales bacterium]|nr:efflux RND transporter periplasmic adaptor subunit [Vicinamibacterales bacterium]
MTRFVNRHTLAAALLAGSCALSACTSADGKAADAPAATTPAVAVAATAAVEQPITRFIRATGSLMAEEQADVAAEIAGRIVATPVERGTPVSEGTVLVRVSPAEADAQAKEAEANAAQIEARLGITQGTAFDVNAVPEVQTAKSSFDLAQNEFNRIKSLLDQRVVSQSEFEQRRTQMDASRQQYEAARNGAAQQYQALQAARARVDIAHKTLADTTVRAPFTGLVAERLVSTGDYVTKGMKVAVVVRVNPLRVQLTVPEQFVSAVKTGASVTFQVDAYPGREFTGTVRYVSPALEANRRALTIEAAVPNQSGDLKPGLFATARIEQPDKVPAVLVPAAAVLTQGGTSRVYVVNGSVVEERIVSIGQQVDTLVEIATGLKAGERVATKNIAQLFDGAKVS